MPEYTIFRRSKVGNLGSTGVILIDTLAVPPPTRSNVLFSKLYTEVATKVGVIFEDSTTVTAALRCTPRSKSRSCMRTGIPFPNTPTVPAIPAPRSSVITPTSRPKDPSLNPESILFTTVKILELFMKYPVEPRLSKGCPNATTLSLST